MKQLFIIANWKSYKNSAEATQWLKEFSMAKFPPEKIVILSPSFPLLPLLSNSIKADSLPVILAAQDISRFDEGAFTGEVNGRLLKDFVSYVIIGHSERRSTFKEADEMISEKVRYALINGLTPILCVQDENATIPDGVELIAYEPVFAIGTGTPQSPERVEDIAKKLRGDLPARNILYGGSVTPDNVHNFTSLENISGVLVGSKSLDSNLFTRIIENA